MQNELYISISALVVIGTLTVPFALFFIMNKITSKKNFNKGVIPDLSSLN